MKYINIILVFTVTLAIFLALEFNANNPYFSGYDSFYHVGLSEHMMQNGFPRQFPYLQFTTLNENFTDNHLLFHILLIPFILLFGNVAGPKIFIALSFALIFVFLYILLRKLKYEWALPFTAIAFFLEPSDFYFRQAFVRNPAPSLLFLLLAILFLAKKRWIALTILSFLYGWLYTGGGFLFLIALLVIYGFVSFFSVGPQRAVSGHATSLQERLRKIDFRLIVFPIIAVGLSLVINPYFPANIKSIYLQVVQTGIGAKDYVGGEWAPYDTWFWLTISYMPLLIWVGGITIALYKKVKMSRIAWTVFFFSIFLLIMQWKSKRFVEYWPFWAIFSGILLAGKQIEEWMLSFWRKPESRKNLNEIFVSLLVLCFLVISYFYASSQWLRAWNDTASKADFDVESAQEAHDYLKSQSNAGDIVFTDDWDVFPLYFFLNQKNYYIVGLDPEFMNQYNPKLYREFASISSGNDPTNLERIKNDFRAKWVIVASDHPEFRANLLAEPKLFTKVFSNKEYTVFKVL